MLLCSAAAPTQRTPLYNPKRRTVVWQTQQSNLLRQRRFSHSTPHLSQVDNQVLTRPGLPWMEKQRHIPGVEVIEEVDILYDSDSFSGSFSDVSGTVSRQYIYIGALMNKLQSIPVIKLTDYSSNRLILTRLWRCPTISFIYYTLRMTIGCGDVTYLLCPFSFRRRGTWWGLRWCLDKETLGKRASQCSSSW